MFAVIAAHVVVVDDVLFEGLMCEDMRNVHLFGDGFC